MSVADVESRRLEKPVVVGAKGERNEAVDILLLHSRVTERVLERLERKRERCAIGKLAQAQSDAADGCLVAERFRHFGHVRFCSKCFDFDCAPREPRRGDPSPRQWWCRTLPARAC